VTKGGHIHRRRRRRQVTQDKFDIAPVLALGGHVVELGTQSLRVRGSESKQLLVDCCRLAIGIIVVGMLWCWNGNHEWVVVDQEIGKDSLIDAQRGILRLFQCGAPRVQAKGKDHMSKTNVSSV